MHYHTTGAYIYYWCVFEPLGLHKFLSDNMFFCSKVSFTATYVYNYVAILLFIEINILCSYAFPHR